MERFAATFALLTFLVLALAPASGQSVRPFAPLHGESADRARDGGVIAGKILGVDYQRGVMSLRAGRGTIDVYVLPTTNIQGKSSNYHTIADLRRGQNVEVFTSVQGPRTNAQIITLK